MQPGPWYYVSTMPWLPITGALLLATLAGGGYLYWQLTETSDTLATVETSAKATETSLRSELSAASTTIADLQIKLSALNEQYEQLAEDYRDERNRNEEFEDQIRRISRTVGTLDKLAKIDKELLQKYSKVYFLNENFVPSSIKQIDNDAVLAGRDSQFFHGDALPFLERMITAAKRDNIELKVVSAYRSFDMQADLKGQFTQVYGTGANAFSADQGYSEHQLGTTVDLTDPATAGTFTAFKDTAAYAWLVQNAHKYGFTLSYPEGNSFYIFEPWHWRFVGEDLAEYLYDNDLHFYDLDQRTLDSYLIKIFD